MSAKIILRAMSATDCARAEREAWEAFFAEPGNAALAEAWRSLWRQLPSPKVTASEARRRAALCGKRGTGAPA